jgi:hypothetical protein
MREDMMFKVTDSNPWYANIVNFMVVGYVSPGEDKKKLIRDSKCHYWDDPYLYRICSDDKLRRCVPTIEGMKIIEKCHAAPWGGDTMVHLVLKRKYIKVNSFGRPCMKTPKILFEGARDANCTGESQQEMQCLYKIINKLSCLTCGD